jgi:hypothetical protein
MGLASNWCEAIAASAKMIDNKCRFKLRGEVKAEPWGNWLIAPTQGYLENDASGPYSIRELEWIEIDPGKAGPKLMVALLAAAGISASIVRHWVQVQVPDAEQ